MTTKNKDIKKMTTRVGSPKTIPRVTLSPKIRQKVSALRKKKSPKNNSFRTHKSDFYANPSINPETKRKIKINGPTYNKLVTKYGSPNYI